MQLKPLSYLIRLQTHKSEPYYSQQKKQVIEMVRLICEIFN